MNFIEKLKKAKLEFEKLGHKSYKKKAMEEVVLYNKQYRESGKYPYNDDIKNFIIEKENLLNLDFDIEKHLGTEVYLSQQDIREEKRLIEKDKMGEIGFLPIKEADEEYLLKHSLILLKIGKDGMFSQEREVKCKILKYKDNKVFFLPPRCRRSGYYLGTLQHTENPTYYKILK